MQHLTHSQRRASWMQVGITPIIATLGESSDGILSLGSADIKSHGAHESRVELSYFAEGAANVLFSIKIIHSSGQDVNQDGLSRAHKVVDGHLLRLRKGTRTPEHHTLQQSTELQQRSVAPPPFVPVKEIDNFLKQHVLEAVPAQYVVDHILMQVHQDFVALCNDTLLALETAGQRDPKRRGWLINVEEPHAFLVADMTARNEEEVTIEFKPKWLAQSPMALRQDFEARRCRTCAWHVKNKVADSTRYCPLSLVSGDAGWVRSEVSRFMPDTQELPANWDRAEAIEAVVNHFCNVASGLRLMRRLEQLQIDWDSDGAISQVAISHEIRQSRSKDELISHAHAALNDPSNNSFETLSWAMTLRDCIIFIRLSKQAHLDEFEIESKIADLDLKRVEPDKLLKWTLDELDLVDGGFYAGTEHLNRSNDICMLWTEEGRALYDRYAKLADAINAVCPD